MKINRLTLIIFSCLVSNLVSVSSLYASEFRACDDQQVYLAVMESARRDIPARSPDWELKGASEIKTIKPGKCQMILLFVNGDKNGKMVELTVQYETTVPLSDIRVR